MTKVEELILMPAPDIYNTLRTRGRPATDGGTEPKINPERTPCGPCLASCMRCFEANSEECYIV